MGESLRYFVRRQVTQRFEMFKLRILAGGGNTRILMSITRGDTRDAKTWFGRPIAGYAGWQILLHIFRCNRLRTAWGIRNIVSLASKFFFRSTHVRFQSYGKTPTSSQYFKQQPFGCIAPGAMRDVKRVQEGSDEATLFTV